jgi:polar amino acid transport system substrate-binding protein
MDGRGNMKRVNLVIPLFLIFAGCSFTTYAKASADLSSPVQTADQTPVSKIIRLTNGEWVPYTGENLPSHGCDSQIVSAVFSRLGYTVEYGFFPWARGFHLAQTGECDGMIEWADTMEARKSFFVSNEAISRQEFVFFHRSDHPLDWETKDDLAGKVIGLTSGYLYSDQFNDLRNDSRFIFQEASSDEANFEKLLAGRIDIFPMERNVGLALLKASFTSGEVEQLVVNKKPLSMFEPHVFLSKKNPENENVMKQFKLLFNEFLYSEEYQKLADECIQ